MDRQAALDILEARTAGFLLFRRLFEAELDRETADAIATEGVAGVLLAVDAHTAGETTEEGGPGSIDTAKAAPSATSEDLGQTRFSTKALESIAQTLSNPIDDPTLAAMGDEYTRLFVGPGKLGAPFWESVYLDERELLFLESTSEVRHLYEREGLQVRTENGREAEDALPFQLDFLATLSQRAAEALNENDADEFHRLVLVQAKFEAGHLANWLPLFAKRAAKTESPVFYPMLCQAVSDFIAIDEQVITPMAE